MKKHLDFEINILPILDILSVLICFLLLTAVWTQIGTLDTRQALGDNSTNGSENPPSLWIAMASDGSLKLALRDIKGKSASQIRERESIVSGSGGSVNWTALEAKIQMVREQLPELKTVVITPEAKTNYGDVIKVMDQLKQKQLTDIGLSPLG